MSNIFICKSRKDVKEICVFVFLVYFLFSGAHSLFSQNSISENEKTAVGAPNEMTDKQKREETTGALKFLKKNENEHKDENAEDGLGILDVVNPEVVLPPVLVLVSEELKSYDIDAAKLSEQIKKKPSQFRKKVPEHLRVRFLALTPEDEKNIGDKIDKEMVASGNVYQNESELGRVQPIVDKIVTQLPEQIPVRIFLYKDDSINAFCLPNGSVYIHSGLLKNVSDDNMLAFVLAHEFGHLAAHHNNEGFTKKLFLLAGNVVADNKADSLEEEGKKIKGNLLRVTYLGGGYAGVLLPFQRKMESEADTLGIRYMARAGYDPQAAVSFWKKLSEENNNIAWLNFLSDHPSDEKRMEKMEIECKELKAGKNLKPPLLDRIKTNIGKKE